MPEPGPPPWCVAWAFVGCPLACLSRPGAWGTSGEFLQTSPPTPLHQHTWTPRALGLLCGGARRWAVATELPRPPPPAEGSRACDPAHQGAHRMGVRPLPHTPRTQKSRKCYSISTKQKGKPVEDQYYVTFSLKIELPVTYSFEINFSKFRVVRPTLPFNFIGHFHHLKRNPVPSSYPSNPQTLGKIFKIHPYCSIYWSVIPYYG